MHKNFLKSTYIITVKTFYLELSGKKKSFNFPELETCIFDLHSRHGILEIHQMAWVSRTIKVYSGATLLLRNSELDPSEMISVLHKISSSIVTTRFLQ